jgi:hypothetical protein
MNSPTKPIDQRLILFYKGHISALVLFAVHHQNCVVFPKALPVLSSLHEDSLTNPSTVILHPASLLQEVARSYGWDKDFLKLESGFCESVATPSGNIQVYLAGFNCLDPPHSQLHSNQCLLKTLPELRRQPPTEIELLRRAYVRLMEG